MQDLIKILIGIVVLFAGVFIGNFLAKVTKEELKSRQTWFRIIIMLSLIGGVIGLIIRNDILMFTMFFIAIVTSQSLKIKKGKR